MLQVQKLVTILSGMGIPPQITDMESKGITPDPKAPTETKAPTT